jgi:hypothetical protein
MRTPNTEFADHSLSSIPRRGSQSTTSPDSCLKGNTRGGQILTSRFSASCHTSAIVLGSGRPNFANSGGSTSRLSSVDVAKPPRITNAIGYSISWPGLLPVISSGTSAKPVVNAVIRIGARRSSAPRMMSSGPKGTPSSRCRCRSWSINMMPLRAATPRTVTKPMSDPSEMTPPDRKAPATPGGSLPYWAIGLHFSSSVSSPAAGVEAFSAADAGGGATDRRSLHPTRINVPTSIPKMVNDDRIREAIQLGSKFWLLMKCSI